MFCPHCAAPLKEESPFCPHCGKAIGSLWQNGASSDGAASAFTAPSSTEPSLPEIDDKEKKALLITLGYKERVLGTLWIVVGTLQVLVGAAIAILIAGAGGGGFAILGCVFIGLGIWNLMIGSGWVSNARKIRNVPVGIVARDAPMAKAILNLALNVYLGTVGVIASLYYLLNVRRFVMQNAAAFLRIEKDYLEKA